MSSTVVQGTVRRAGAPLGGAYVQVLDPDGAFTGERRTAPDGRYRFHLVPGRWSIVAFAPRTDRAVHEIDLVDGQELELPLELPEA